MKKTLIIAALCASAFTTFGQDTNKATHRYLNEFGIDATSFLKQFLNFNSSTTYPSYYQPIYYLTYRRHFNGGNLRAAIGADFQDNQLAPNYPTDSNKYYLKSTSIYALVGWEFYNNLGKRWQVFYGLDFRTSLSNRRDDEMYSDGGYTYGEETRSQVYGLAPFLGFRFNLTKRLSILTETSYSVNMEQDENKTFFTPIPGNTPLNPAPTPTDQKTKKIFSNYTAPVSIYIDFTI